MDEKDRLEIDQKMSEKIRKEFDGKIIEVQCFSCSGKGYYPRGKNGEIKEKCFECDGKGSVPIQW